MRRKLALLACMAGLATVSYFSSGYIWEKWIGPMLDDLQDLSADRY